MSNSLPRHDNPRDAVTHRATGRSPEASGTRSRLSLRNLLVVSVAAAGLSIVPVGIATAAPTAATAAGATYHVGAQDYHQAAGSFDPYNGDGGVEVVLPG